MPRIRLRSILACLLLAGVLAPAWLPLALGAAEACGCGSRVNCCCELSAKPREGMACHGSGLQAQCSLKAAHPHPPAFTFALDGHSWRVLLPTWEVQLELATLGLLGDESPLLPSCPFLSQPTPPPRPFQVL